MKRLIGFIRGSMSLILSLTALGVLGASLVGFTDLRGYIADQCSQLRIVYLFGLGFMLVPVLLVKSRFGLGILCAAALVNISQIVPFYFPANENAEASTKSDRSRELVVVAINLWGRYNSDYDKVTEYLKQVNPDLLCLSEVNQMWLTRISKDLPEYKYQLQEGISGGAAIYSKFPIERAVRANSLGMREYGVRGKCTVAGKEVMVISAHPPAPYRPMTWKARNKEFERLATDLSKAGSPSILIGDLNSSPWSKYFKTLLKNGNLKDSEIGKGIQPSWNATLFIPAMVPIDHCLVSKDIVVLDRSVGPYVGSDHLPVCVKLQIQSI